MANISGFQPEDEGSIPFTCSIPFNGDCSYNIESRAANFLLGKLFLLKKGRCYN